MNHPLGEIVSVLDPVYRIKYQGRDPLPSVAKPYKFVTCKGNLYVADGIEFLLSLEQVGKSEKDLKQDCLCYISDRIEINPDGKFYLGSLQNNGR